MAKKRVKLSKLVMDFNLYPRTQVDNANVGEMVEALKVGRHLPAIVVDSKSMRIVDGFHRLSALRRFHDDPEAKITVDVIPYESEGALFADALSRNAGHGRKLSPFDKARSVELGESFGLTRDAIADALNIRRERLDSFILSRVSADGEVLKATVKHLQGEELTSEQRDYNRRAGGMNQLFYIRQVVALVESDSVDWKRDEVRDTLAKLAKLLDERLAVA